ncbi:MAG: hypothetical protein QN159_03820 [Armatimonadota bacterium]|nr:hypothetical protein [Armatimonadota bacterium]
MNRSLAFPTAVLAAVLACALAAAAAPVPSPSPDPRIAEIRRRIEHLGLRVTDAGHAPATSSAPAVWLAITPAQYREPSWARVTDQALTVWAVMFHVLKSAPDRTLLISAQDWRTFRLFVSTPFGSVAAFDRGVRTARTDTDRQKTHEALYAGATLRVFDLRQEKWLETTEFVRQWFTK